MSKRNRNRRRRREAPTEDSQAAAKESQSRSDDSGADEAEAQESAPPARDADGDELDASEASDAKGTLPATESETQADTLRTEDRPSLRRAWARHDLWVILVALVVLATGGLISRNASTPTMREFRLRGLSFSRPEGFLPPTPVAAQASPVASALSAPANFADPLADDAGPPPIDDILPSKSAPTAPEAHEPSSYHVIYQGPTTPLLRLEVRIDARPMYNNLVGALSLYRAGRYGGSYWASDGRIRNIGGRDWTRTEFRYTYKASEIDSPRVATAIEYATLNEDLLYVVTFHGTPEQALELSEMVSPTLTVRNTAPAGESAP